MQCIIFQMLTDRVDVVPIQTIQTTCDFSPEKGWDCFEIPHFMKKPTVLLYLAHETQGLDANTLHRNLFLHNIIMVLN